MQPNLDYDGQLSDDAALFGLDSQELTQDTLTEYIQEVDVERPHKMLVEEFMLTHESDKLIEYLSTEIAKCFERWSWSELPEYFGDIYKTFAKCAPAIKEQDNEVRFIILQDCTIYRTMLRRSIDLWGPKFQAARRALRTEIAIRFYIQTTFARYLRLTCKLIILLVLQPSKECTVWLRRVLQYQILMDEIFERLR